MIGRKDLINIQRHKYQGSNACARLFLWLFLFIVWSWYLNCISLLLLLDSLRIQVVNKINQLCFNVTYSAETYFQKIEFSFLLDNIFFIKMSSDIYFYLYNFLFLLLRLTKIRCEKIKCQKRGVSYNSKTLPKPFQTRPRRSHQKCSIKKRCLLKGAWGLQLNGKRDSGTGVFQYILRNFLEHLFYRTPPDDFFCRL